MTKQKNRNVPLTGSDTIVGLFREQSQAERAIRELQRAGFADDQIGVLMRDRERQQELAENTGTKAEEGAAAGAVGGGIVGGTLGLLAGVGALVIPGIGPIVAAGTIASTLAGAGIGAAAGGLLGALIGMGIPEEEARHFEQGVQSGGILVTVRTGARAEEARAILAGEGAEFGRPEVAGSTGHTRDVGTAATAEGGERLKLREEVLRAHKERVETGVERVTDTVRREEARVDTRGDTHLQETRGIGEPWRGNERRYRNDPQYTGPDRRMSNV